MKMRAFALLSISAVLLAAISAHSQGAGTLQSSTAAPSRGMIGLGRDTPGTNSLGTAQSAGGSGGGQGAAAAGDDPAVKAEEGKVDKSLKSICRGC